MTAAFTIEMPMATCEKPNHSKNVQNDSHHHFIVALLLLPKPALARDERSIKDPRKALAALAPDVDPAEAELLSVTAHTKARSLAREYRFVLNRQFTVFLVNVGMHLLILRLAISSRCATKLRRKRFAQKRSSITYLKRCSREFIFRFTRWLPLLAFHMPGQRNAPGCRIS